MVRAFAQSAMGRRIDPSWWTHTKLISYLNNIMKYVSSLLKGVLHHFVNELDISVRDLHCTVVGANIVFELICNNHFIVKGAVSEIICIILLFFAVRVLVINNK